MTLHFAIQFFLSLSLTYSHLVMKTKIIFSIVAFTERKKIYNEVPPLLIYECSFKKKKKNHEKPHTLFQGRVIPSK